MAILLALPTTSQPLPLPAAPSLSPRLTRPMSVLWRCHLLAVVAVVVAVLAVSVAVTVVAVVAVAALVQPSCLRSA